MTRKAQTTAAQKRRTAAATGGVPRWGIAAALGGVVVVAAALALFLSTSRPPISEPSTVPVVVTGTRLPAFPASGDDPAVGMMLPTLQGLGLDGSSLTIEADGRPKAIVILAHWCPHCQAEVPRIVDWLATHPAPDGVDVVGLSTAISETRPNYPPSEWLAGEGWQQPTMIDDANSTGYVALGGPNFPGWVFVGADGRVQLRTTGELDPAQFGAILDQLAP